MLLLKHDLVRDPIFINHDGLVYVGIDPGLHTGIAVYDPTEQELVVVDTLPFWKAVEKVGLIGPPECTAFVVEDPNLLSPVFDYDQDHEDPERRRRGREKIAQNVGMNKRDAQLWIDLLHFYGYAVAAVNPQERGEKWTDTLFRGITGYKGTASQHARDAASLVWGRSQPLRVFRKLYD